MTSAVILYKLQINQLQMNTIMKSTTKYYKLKRKEHGTQFESVSFCVPLKMC